MKKKLSTPIVFVVALAIGISLSATAAFAWDAPTHAYIAGEIMDCGPICSYDAEMGSLAPDFAWYLRDKGLITDENEEDEGEATLLHNNFYAIASEKLHWWNFRLRNFVDGAFTHSFCADPIADESIEIWYATFPGGVADDDKQAFHLAFEFAVGSLVVYQEGLQVWDLLFAHRQATFVEEVVEDFVGRDLGNVSLEFKKYLALMRLLEKVARLYAPYLMKGEVDAEFISQALSWEFLDSVGELSQESLAKYVEVAKILLIYPDRIYRTITGDLPDGEPEPLNWEDAVDDVIEDCVIPGW